MGIWPGACNVRRCYALPVHIMRALLTLCLAAAALQGGMVWAIAAPGINSTAGLLTDHDRLLKYQDQHSASPYPMNFTDDAAQTLGVHDGRWEAFDTGPSRNGYMPGLSGGIVGGAAMIKLQWRPGQ